MLLKKVDILNNMHYKFKQKQVAYYYNEPNKCTICPLLFITAKYSGCFFFRCRWSHSAGWIIADQAVPNESGGDTPTQCSERGCANAADDALLRQVRNCILSSAITYFIF